MILEKQGGICRNEKFLDKQDDDKIYESEKIQVIGNEWIPFSEGGVDMTSMNNFADEKKQDMCQSHIFNEGSCMNKKVSEESVIPLLTNIAEISKFVGIWEKEKKCID